MKIVSYTVFTREKEVCVFDCRLQTRSWALITLYLNPRLLWHSFPSDRIGKSSHNLRPSMFNQKTHTFVSVIQNYWSCIIKLFKLVASMNFIMYRGNDLKEFHEIWLGKSISRSISYQKQVSIYYTYTHHTHDVYYASRYIIVITHYPRILR